MKYGSNSVTVTGSSSAKKMLLRTSTPCLPSEREIRRCGQTRLVASDGRDRRHIPVSAGGVHRNPILLAYGRAVHAVDAAGRIQGHTLRLIEPRTVTHDGGNWGGIPSPVGRVCGNGRAPRPRR